MLRHPPRFADAFVGLTLGEELEKMATIKKVSADSPDKAGTSNTKHVFQVGLVKWVGQFDLAVQQGVS